MSFLQIIKLISGIWLIVTLSSCAQRKQLISSSAISTFVDKEFADAGAQYHVLINRIKPDQFPKAYFPSNDSLSTSNSSWWCSGFYPGSLLFIFEQTKDLSLKAEADRILKVLEKEQYNKGTHDLGFMMFCSFGNANRLEPKGSYEQILINSAKSLSTRFDPRLGVIKSWDSKKPSDYLVIIDNMMNLELLFWATKATGDSSFYKIAVSHADNTIKHHFRPDFSSYHVINYDRNHPGNIQEKKTAQGYSNSSAWARGQAWGLYGFVVMYRATKDEKYLRQAEGISQFILNHPNLPADKIPYWDFNAPNIPEPPRDVSAAAIMASAWLELATYSNRIEADRYRQAAIEILNNLSKDAYKAQPNTNGGFILKHSVGHLPANSEVDVAISYADYYYLESLKRFKQGVQTAK